MSKSLKSVSKAEGFLFVFLTSQSSFKKYLIG